MSILYAAMISTLLAAPAPQSWGARASELRRLLQARRFAEVERSIVAAQDRFDRGETQEDESWAIPGVFLDDDEPTAVALSEWVARSPKSYAGLVARGSYRHSTGWLKRGGKWVSETTARELRSMSEFHAAAVADCEAALVIKPTLVACHVALINIAKGAGESTLARRRYDAARRMVPKSTLVVNAYVQSLTPRWGGSYGEMAAFFRGLEADRSLPAGVQALRGEVEADQAFSATQQQDWAGAVALYAQAISRGGGTAVHYAGRGTNALRLKRYGDAARDFGRAMEMARYGWPYGEEKLPAVLAMRASLWRSLKQAAAAQADIAEAVALDPRDSYVKKWAEIILRPEDRR